MKSTTTRLRNIDRLMIMKKMLSLGLAMALAMPGAAHAQWRAGAGKAVIDLPASLLPIDKFTTVLDPLSVRVLVLGDGKTRAALALIDQTSLGAGDVGAMKAVVAKATGVPVEAVLVIASHTFSAPHMFAANPPPGMAVEPEESARAKLYAANVMAALEQAARDAAKGEVPASLRFGTGVSHVAVNRNVDTPQGWWLGTDETGFTDPTVSMLTLVAGDQRVIGALMNYAVQSSVMDQTGAPDGGKAVSADLAGVAMARVEAKLGGVGLFATGAAGDQVPTYAARRYVYGTDGKAAINTWGAGAYPLVALQGERLGDAALRAAEAAKPVAAGPLGLFTGKVTLSTQERPKQLAQLKPSRDYHYAINGKADAPYTLLTLGDVAIVGVQVELNAATGAWIRAHSPYRHTIVATMVNGAAKYLPDAQSYQRITYQAMNSSYGPGSAEVMASAIVKQLGAMAKAGKAAK
jgi:neutral ceramidase